ncbi:MAG: hypothetical protein GY814_12780 [Gammaproteobacteria bacterium]|nr:hypothetical protein [Gammaproteobacteria bacterium]
MATPISNDKILPSESTRTPISSKKGTEQGGTNGPDTTKSTQAANDIARTETNTVDVERANQIFNQSELQASGESSISTPEQARLVAAELKELIEDDGLQALQAQAGPASANLSALLEAAPA